MPDRASAVTIIPFTDLVGSTELLSRVGDEEAQSLFRAHHDLLAEAAAAHGGEESPTRTSSPPSCSAATNPT